MNIRFRNYSIVIFCLIIIAGCAKKNTITTQSQEDVLRKRVTEFWNHRVNLELDKCYYYEYPLLRKKVSIVSYIKSFNTALVKWKSFSIQRIEFLDNENAAVTLNVTSSVKIPGMKRFQRDNEIEQKWIQYEGTWFHVSKKFL